MLLADANMMMLDLVRVMEKFGIRLTVIAWTPWKRQDGTLVVDSCAIYMVGIPSGIFELEKSLKDLHARDATGILWEQPRSDGQGSRPTGGFQGGFHYVGPPNCGHGCILSSYQPKSKLPG